jgi:probable phosphoglycerate mutase
MKNRYFLMRHGESQANKQRLIISDPATGCKLYGLTAKGREQAKESVAKSGLSKHTIIVSSDFARARETARIAQDTLRSPEIVLRQGLRERFFGKLEGRPTDEYGKVWAHDDVDSLHTPFGAESPRYLAHRMCKVVSRGSVAFSSASYGQQRPYRAREDKPFRARRDPAPGKASGLSMKF